MFDPITTYRLQFHKGFTFSDFQLVLPYLHKLGVSTIYASPVFQATKGSTHGYDVLDPLQINPEIGTLQQLNQIRQQLKEMDINWLQDIVPNHMAFHAENPWLIDVFENGQRSAFARFFDIDWNHPAYPNRIMIPFFGFSQNELIKNSDIKVEFHSGKLVFVANGDRYPIKPLSYQELTGSETPAFLKDLIKDITAIDQIKKDNTYTEKWNEWLNKLGIVLKNPQLLDWLNKRLDEVNQNKDLLQKVADEQHYCFCNWQETSKVINYRRFFTVNGLISLNMQDEEVFQYHHKLVKDLLEEDLVQGLRVDHIDGLYNPGEYLQRLRSLAGAGTYIAVEKILEPDENLETSWPVQGTTGYDFLAMVSNLLTEKKNEEVFTSFYNKLAGKKVKVPRQVRKKKEYILTSYMAGDLDNLYNLFVNSALASAEQIQSLSGGTLKKAIGAFLIYCPVYRYYGDTLPLPEKEATEVQAILNRVKHKERDLTEAVELLETAWLHTENSDEGYRDRAAAFYKRCMQFSGPLMAKGVEDTLMYSFNRFIVHNEVGDAPDAFGDTIDGFHRKMKDRLQHWPLSLNATSTHDTKRGEDVRARLNVLTELPGEWFENITRWQELNSDLRQNNAPDENDEYFIYQTLMGTYPMPGAAEENYAERLQEYLQKAMREAKSHTDWTEPDEKYETGAKQFAIGLLDKEKPFWKSFSQLHETVSDYGIINSLVQVLLKFTCPGVPDVYQGCELWDLSFVDPDNRRPVPFDKHEDLFDAFPLNEKGAVLAEKLWKKRFDGRIKMWLVNTLMQIRKQQPELFTHGSYIPLGVEGDYKENIIAFARKLGETWLVIALPLHVTTICREQQKPVNRLDWKNTTIVLPQELKGNVQDLLSGFSARRLSRMPVKQLFNSLPFSIIKIEVENNARGAGILLHLSSLPSPFGVGDLGPEAFSFADFLYRSGQKYWQVLPVNPVESGQGYSPYSSTCSHAGNILFISPELLAEEGLLNADQLQQFHVPLSGKADYARAEKIREELLSKAWNAFNLSPSSGLQKAFVQFCKDEDDWLHDYALYSVLKENYNGKPWYEWDEDYKQHHNPVLKALAAKENDRISKIKWLQFIFNRQWHGLKDYCNSHLIQIIGDLPFYVSYDSADVWAQREIFSLDKNGGKTGIAGVPPDVFSEDGQLWGMPVFKWDVLKKQDYRWWISRLNKNKEMFDMIRLDHFRAFASYWEVPAGETTARKGEWIQGPGEHFFRTVKKEIGTLPFLAEDLGDIDEPVYDLRDEFGFPGMKVLQFAFGENFPFSDYLPHNFKRRFFAYTGTHDNNTTRGWFMNEASPATIRNLEKYAGQTVNEENVHVVLSQLAYASIANTVIVPLQDLLGLDESARMNKPSSANDNWAWQLLPSQLTEEAGLKLREWMYIYNRG